MAYPTLSRMRIAMLTMLGLLASVGRVHAAEPDVGSDLSVNQAVLADRYERLEMVAARLAELSASTDPRRARRLQEAISRSREQELGLRFEETVKLLESERLAAAVDNQGQLQKELGGLLELLLKDSRESEIDSEQERIRQYLKEVGRLIRWQKSIHARTEGGDELEDLHRDQEQAADQTGRLGGEIKETEGSESAEQSSGEPSDGSQENKPSEGQPSEGQPSEGQPSEGQPSEGQPSEGQPVEGQPNEGEEGGEPQQGEGQQGGKPQQGEGEPPQQGQGQGQQGQGQQGAPGESGDQQSPPQAEQPADRAVNRLQAAEERMQKAVEELEQAERAGAAEAQQEALAELEQARAELERVLRQLREEELERTLTQLAARFRKMLEAEVKVYEGTLQLDSVAAAERDHREEIEAARLSREQTLIARDAEKALLLLQEDGSSVAFPEAVEQMHTDMLQVAGWLAQLKVGEMTQIVEQDIIESLEEAIAALEQALEDLEKEKQQNQMPPGSGQPQEPALVDKIQELKMIRSLQIRINRRTTRYGTMIAGEQAESADLVEALGDLGRRQQSVHRATRDLALGRND